MKESRNETGRVEAFFAFSIHSLVVFRRSELFDDVSNEFEGKEIEIASERRRGREGIGRHDRIDATIGRDRYQLLPQSISTVSEAVLRPIGDNGDEEERKVKRT